MDDAMFCEACGAHRDQLGLAGDDIRACPECERATCSNCWNRSRAPASPAGPSRCRSPPRRPPRRTCPWLRRSPSPPRPRPSHRRLASQARQTLSGPPSRSRTRSWSRCRASWSPAPAATLAAVSSRAARFGTIRIGRRHPRHGHRVRPRHQHRHGRVRRGPPSSDRRPTPSRTPDPGGPTSEPDHHDRESTTKTVPATTDPIEVASTSGPDDRGNSSGDSGPTTGTNAGGGRPGRHDHARPGRPLPRRPPGRPSRGPDERRDPDTGPTADRPTPRARATDATGTRSDDTPAPDRHGYPAPDPDGYPGADRPTCRRAVRTRRVPYDAGVTDPPVDIRPLTPGPLPGPRRPVRGRR